MEDRKLERAVRKLKESVEVLGEQEERRLRTAEGKELAKILNEYPDAEVWIAKDEEGNAFAKPYKVGFKAHGPEMIEAIILYPEGTMRDQYDDIPGEDPEGAM